MALPDELKAVLADRSAPLAQVMKAVSAGERALGEADDDWDGDPPRRPGPQSAHA